MADLERIKAIESDKVNRWCKDNGIESNTDLAFFFLNYQEALDAAGRAVADAWSMARHAAAPGLAVGVRGAVRVEQARPSTSSLPSREMPPAIRAQLRPSAALPRSVVKGGSLPASAYIQPGSERAPAEGESQLLAIMLAKFQWHLLSLFKPVSPIITQKLYLLTTSPKLRQQSNMIDRAINTGLTNLV